MVANYIFDAHNSNFINNRTKVLESSHCIMNSCFKEMWFAQVLELLCTLHVKNLLMVKHKPKYACFLRIPGVYVATNYITL